MFSYRFDKVGFFAGIVLLTIVVGTVVSTVVLILIGLAKGDWTAYLIPVKVVLGCGWVLSIITVLVRVHAFRAKLHKQRQQKLLEEQARQQAEHNSSPAVSSNGAGEPAPEASTRETSEQR